MHTSKGTSGITGFLLTERAGFFLLKGYRVISASRIRAVPQTHRCGNTTNRNANCTVCRLDTGARRSKWLAHSH